MGLEWCELWGGANDGVADGANGADTAGWQHMADGTEEDANEAHIHSSSAGQQVARCPDEEAPTEKAALLEGADVGSGVALDVRGSQQADVGGGGGVVEVVGSTAMAHGSGILFCGCCCGIGALRLRLL